MACETPVIAVREGGIQETVVHQQTGLLVERDREKFADGISQLMKDSETADRFGKAGRAHVLQNWTWERSVDELEMLLSF
jgi:glycosyltransferase involved in cell wall biosynthesis